MTSSSFLRVTAAFWLAALAANGCGGSTDTRGSTGAIAGQICSVEGQQTYAADGCNTCTCTAGKWACTAKDCSATCTNGATQFDGCNTCSCTNGMWACTKKACPVCVDGTTTFDGCNTCSCSNGTWQCTMKACPVCTDGTTTFDGCNTCSCSAGQWLCTQKACPVPECPAPTPQDPTQGCILVEVYAKDPVSGTCCKYGDPCSAPAGWQQFYSMAACTGTTCTPGQTQPAPDGCNTCSCGPDGTWMCTAMACPVPPPDGGVGCGGWLGDTCTATEYCAYVEGQMCGAADASSVCKSRPQACDLIYAPVCGCDGKTYGNDCEAASNGTGVMHSGACP